MSEQKTTPQNDAVERSVVVVDDTEMVRLVIAMVVKTFKLGQTNPRSVPDQPVYFSKVLVADGPPEAEKIIFELNPPPELVISDRQMPTGCGLEFLSRLADRGFRKLLLITGAADSEGMQESIDCITELNSRYEDEGMRAEVLFKPASRVEIFEALNLVLEAE